nr:insulinase family protein [Lachnospiraceae bacterium]
MKRIEDLTAYEILEKREISDLSSTGYRLRHRKTGAKICLLSNRDDNKVFFVGFRTPPTDSTGVAHILEHSTLCGSREFPVKDPFVELVKGSLNTFLNAMTYPDKTMYPVASCNDKDFRNLMHVYLDAVFYPKVYENESIFRQEGWHYEFDEDGKLFINGVVYNEMKGALSTPDDILEREIMNSLYPDVCYGVESGGDPEFIPDLTYEQFLDFHRAYYHPSNSYIYLYGDMDMAEQLEFIDAHYLSHFEYRAVDSEVGLQKPFSAVRHVAKECPLGEGEDPVDNTFLSVNYTLADSLDRDLYIAFQVLDYALCSAPGAPVKKTLVERGIGRDVYSIYENGIRQPYFSFVAKGTELSREEEFLSVIRGELEKIVREGFDKKSLLAAINHFEFRYREADYGMYPKGLMLGLQAMDSWLYDENLPFHHIEANATYAKLRSLAETDYFEQLVKTYFLDNPHSSIVTVVPEEGVEEAREEKLAKRLEDFQAGLSEQQMQEIRETFARLRQFQEREDTKEDLATLPMLRREDLKKEAQPLCNEERTLGDTKLLFHEQPTNGIAYLQLVFSMDDLPGEYYPYISLLKAIWGMVDTDAHDYADLNNEINLVTGGSNIDSNIYVDLDTEDDYSVSVEARVKYLYPRQAEAVALLEEILFTSHLDDTVRILEILQEVKSQMQAGMMGAGNRVAVLRAQAGLKKSGRVEEIMNGLEFYRFLSDLLEHYEERKAQMVDMLRETCKMLPRPEIFSVDLTGEASSADGLEEALSSLRGRMYTEPVRKERFVPELLQGNEGWMNAGQVQFVCRAGDYR